jgi:hypothetical protein
MWDVQMTKVKLQDLIKFITQGKMLNITTYRLQYLLQVYCNSSHSLLGCDPTTSLHSVTTQETATWIFTATKTSSVTYYN